MPSCERHSTSARLPKGRSKRRQRRSRSSTGRARARTTAAGRSTASTKSSQVGMTLLGGRGWYKFKSEQRNGRRTGRTTYLKINHVESTTRRESHRLNRMVWARTEQERNAVEDDLDQRDQFRRGWRTAAKRRKTSRWPQLFLTACFLCDYLRTLSPATPIVSYGTEGA